MPCWKRQTERKIKKYRKNAVVYPQPNPPTFTADEKIKCGGCDESFDLGSNELKIHCNLCNQLLTSAYE